ncbi:MAG TPA: L,D-transpeptidase family protein [Mycobacteriales bacterium]|nr:L,D-transpeptidase family protein [Mycobacteriales bacterium]
MRRRPLLVPFLVAGALVLAGCSGASAPAVPVAAPQSAEATSSPVPSDGPTLTAAANATVDPSAPTPTPSATAPPAAAAYDVAAVQRRLTEQKYYVGAVDGRAGPSLRSAVMAFQKVNGLGADGTVGPATLAALAAPKAPQLQASAPANRVEVDLTRQVLYVVKGGAVARVLPVSSGNGATYSQKNGSTARALTPTGWYRIERRIVGERHADLGTLYDPQYFYRGWAIHGSNSVPAGPASHGCVRVTRTDAKWLLDAIGVGTSVYLYGGTHVFSAGSSAPGTDNPSGDGAPSQPAPPPATTPPPATPSPQPSSPPPSSPAPSGPPPSTPPADPAPVPPADPAPPAP